ncbi:hypothetical protein GMDG_07277 [Pseudogymnoascus destructans 20631-21]|uniref:Uncharacterized protein n=1 Tax=Pseudogymnoascus destructans (strain ATCC MYA-4855 / 20631-21) TaxID=658429 RepID=L8FXK7_PSED2|nr:hypothetical protein GMDG_07277 [Pseudogymnoascus destructans 20631-21]
MSGWEDHSDADDDGNSVFGEAPLPPANIQQVAEQIAQGLLNLDESMEPADDEFDNPDSYSVELPVEDSVPDEDFLPIGDAPPDDDPGLEMDAINGLETPLSRSEKLLYEDSFEYISPKNIVSRVEISMDYIFEGPVALDNAYVFNDKTHIRRILNMARKDIRPAAQSRPHIAELEIEAYGRAWIVDAFRDTFISLPMIIFMDAFGLFRNRYRSMMGIYMTTPAQCLRDRMKRSNNFVLSRMLDKGMILRINGENRFVIAPVLCFTGDMPQQNENSGILRPNAGKGCRSCLASIAQKGDLDFDTVALGRYHYSQKQIREYGDTLPPTAKKKYFQEWGMHENEPAIFKLTPALDIIQTRPGDPCHSEYNGQAKQSHNLLMRAILSKPGMRRYFQEFVQFPAPTGWSTRQSPLNHLQSWSLSEAGMASVLTPLIMSRMKLSENDITLNFFAAMRGKFREDTKTMKLTIPEILVHCFAMMAKSNAITCARKISEHLVRMQGASFSGVDSSTLGCAHVLLSLSG